MSGQQAARQAPPADAVRKIAVRWNPALFTIQAHSHVIHSFFAAICNHVGGSCVSALAPPRSISSYRSFPMDWFGTSGSGAADRLRLHDLGNDRPVQAHFLQAFLRGDRQAAEDTSDQPTGTRRGHPPALTNLLRGRTPNSLVAVSQRAHQLGDIRDKEIFDPTPASPKSTTTDGAASREMKGESLIFPPHPLKSQAFHYGMGRKTPQTRSLSRARRLETHRNPKRGYSVQASTKLLLELAVSPTQATRGGVKL